MSDKKQDIRIVILVGGWVMVGEYSRDMGGSRMTRAHIIRQWGTGEGDERGLGTLAYMGPRHSTQLDPLACVEWPMSSEIMTFPCDAAKWAETIAKAPASLGFEQSTKIVVLVGGWVVGGKYARDSSGGRMTRGHIIRQWGTGEGEERGLGTLAYMGPRPSTQLDPLACVEWPLPSEIMTFPCAEDKWAETLAKAPAPVGIMA